MARHAEQKQGVFGGNDVAHDRRIRSFREIVGGWSCGSGFQAGELTWDVLSWAE